MDLALDPVESTTYTALTKDITTAPQTFILGWCADYPDPQNWLSVYWKTGGFGERIGYSNADFDALVNEADTTIDPAKRAELYAQAQTLLTDGAPVAFAWNNVNTLPGQAVGHGHHHDPAGLRLGRRKGAAVHRHRHVDDASVATEGKTTPVVERGIIRRSTTESGKRQSGRRQAGAGHCS